MRSNTSVNSGINYTRHSFQLTYLPKRKIPPSAPLVIPPVRAQVRRRLRRRGGCGRDPGAKPRSGVRGGGEAPQKIVPKKAYIWHGFRQSGSWQYGTQMTLHNDNTPCLLSSNIPRKNVFVQGPRNFVQLGYPWVHLVRRRRKFCMLTISEKQF